MFGRREFRQTRGRPGSPQRTNGHLLQVFLDEPPSNVVRITAIDDVVPIDSECGEEQPNGVGVQGVDESDLQLWPGSDLKLEKYLPGSVYLWACGEHGKEGGETTSCVSRSEAAAAWVVLVVSTE